MLSKVCRRCNRDLGVTEFGRNKRASDGIKTYCRACDAALNRAKYQRDPAHALAKSQQRHRENPDRRKSITLKMRYGITLENWNALLAQQNFACAVCETRDPGKWHTDHCHSTGIVRGILCDRCNPMLGYARDNADTLMKAVKYLLLS